MHDLGYLIAGYGATVAGLAWYRWRLAVRAHRARTVIATVSGRPAHPRRSPVGARAARTRR